MDTSTGKVGELTEEEHQSMVDRIREKLGRDPVPGDRVDADPASPRVLVSPEVARRAALAENERRRRERRPRVVAERKPSERSRARRKRQEQRRRAHG